LNEGLASLLNAKEAYYEKLHAKVVLLRHDLENANNNFSKYQKLKGGSRILNDILIIYRVPLIKRGLRFEN